MEESMWLVGLKCTVVKAPINFGDINSSPALTEERNTLTEERILHLVCYVVIIFRTRDLHFVLQTRACSDLNC